MAQVVKRCACADKAKCRHSWTVRWWADGRQHEKSFHRNYREAQKFSKTIEADKLDVHRGDAPPPIGFRDYAEQWIAAHPGPAGTTRIYGQELRLRLIPEFGTRKLHEVADDREGVTAFLRSLPVPTARVCHTALSALLSEARHAGRIRATRLSGIRLEAAAPKDFDFPDYAQLTALVAAIPESVRLAIWIMRGTGARPGEALALRAESFTKGHVRIAEQRMQHGSEPYGPLKARKPGEFRDVPCPDYLKALVAEHPVKSGYLFDVPYRRFSKYFRDAARKTGLPESVTPHTLRHVFATVCLSQGVPITDVARWLGHRNIQLTFATYSHFIPSAWDTARAALDSEYQDWSTS